MESTISALVTEEEEAIQPTMALQKGDTLTLVSTPTPTVAAPTHTPMTMNTITAMVTDTHTAQEWVPTSTPVKSTFTQG